MPATAGFGRSRFAHTPLGSEHRRDGWIAASPPAMTVEEFCHPFDDVSIVDFPELSR